MTSVAATDSTPNGSNSKWAALFIASLGSFNVAVDVYIVNISLPVLRGLFGVSHEVILWVQLVFPVLSSSLFLICGRLGDRLGRERVYMLGLSIYVVALGLCALAPNVGALIVFRVIQVVGMAMLNSIAPAIAISGFPNHERGKALGIHLAIFASGAVAGPVLGGFLLDHLAWQSIFYLRLPLAVSTLALAFFFLKRQPPVTEERGFDIKGTLFLFMTLSSLILALNQIRIRGWDSPLVLGFGAAAIVLFVLLLKVEKRAKQPVLELKLFQSGTYTAAIFAMGLSMMGLLLLDVVMPFYVVEGAGYSATVAGTVMMSYIGVLTVMHAFAGWLADKIGAARLVTFGLAVGVLSLILFRGAGADTSQASLVLRAAVVGFAVGFYFVPVSSMIMNAVPQERLGTASAMLSTTRQIGSSIGSATFITIFTTRKVIHTGEFAAQGIGEDRAEQLGAVGGFHDAALASIGVTALALLFSLRVLLKGRGQSKVP